MSDIKSSPIDIPKKKHSKSTYSFNEPPSDSSTYLFELELFVKKEKKTYRKIENKKYTQFLDVEDRINYKDISKFKVIISKIPSREGVIYNLESKINHKMNYYNERNNDIYIEFTKNVNGFTLCSCYFVGVDFSQIMISPPH